ncbi:MAG TPA: redoxin domain-containing protein [Bryobacteraceae bacterium]|nr:redoxin domain-containing protein [Bryobacteraceae bacterium]
MLQRILEFLFFAILCMALLWFSAVGAYPAVPAFQLRDTVGALHTPADWSGARAILLFFVTNDCPVTNSYVPEMNRIQAAYAPRGVRTYAVEADPGVAPLVVAAYARDYHYGFPLLLDPLQDLVQLTGATVTPEAAVLTPEGKVVYRGRIDNRVADFGKQRPQATVHDLRDALDEVLAGKPVPTPFTRSIGCAIVRDRSGDL